MSAHIKIIDDCGAVPEVYKEFPDMPQDIEGWLKYDVLHEYYIFHFKKKAEVYCTQCNSTFPVSKISEYDEGVIDSGDWVDCPECGMFAIFQDSKYMDNICEELDVAFFSKKGNAVYGRIYALDLTYEDCQPDFTLYLRAIYKFSSEEEFYYSRRKANVNRVWVKENEISIPPGRGYGYYIFPGNLDTLCEGTDLKYADLELHFLNNGEEDHLFAYHDPNYCDDLRLRYCVEDVFIYLSYFMKYPAIELLEKTGFDHLIIDKLSEKVVPASAAHIINWEATNLREAFGLDKSAIRELREADVSCAEIESYKYYFKKYPDIKSKAALLLAKCNIGSGDLKAMTKYASTNKIANYLATQAGLENVELSSYRYSSRINDYRDYLRECEELGIDLTRKSNLFPKNLLKAHSATSTRIKISKDEKVNKRIIEVAQAQEQLNYSDNHFSIHVANNMEELINEGKSLNHCVGQYAKRVADGKTLILFVRDMQDEEKPFYTLELKDKEIIQCRGESNCSMTEEVQQFIDKWHKKVVLKKPAKNKKSKKKVA